MKTARMPARYQEWRYFWKLPAAALLSLAMLATAHSGYAREARQAARNQAGNQAGNQVVPTNVAPHPAPMQPLPYSHKTHIAAGLQCQVCHTNPEPGNRMTFPATSTCMMCHTIVAKDKPSIMKLAEFAKSGEPIPWVRVYQVTPGVTWSHRKHLQAGLQCGMCHGNVGQLEAMSETTSVTSMASCISCHQMRQVGTTCATCHSWPAN